MAEPLPAHLFAPAREAGRSVLLETEGLALLDHLRIDRPRSRFLAPGEDPAAALADLPGDLVVVKAVSPGLVHKSEAGAVTVVRRDAAAVEAARDAMALRLGPAFAGATLHEFIPARGMVGEDWLLGLRVTPDFGPVLTLGPGGVQTEFLGERLGATTHLAAGWTPPGGVGRALEANPLLPWILGQRRGLPPLVDRGALEDLLLRVLRVADAMPFPLAELEINPLRLSGGRLLALDVHARLGEPAPALPAPRPREAIEALLHPRSLAVIGVSERRNPGRIVLDNTLAAGFDPAAITLVKPGRDELAGVRCVPTLEDLPEPVDALVLAVSADQVPDLLDTAIERRLARGVILLPGGLGERAGTEDRAAALAESLARSRTRPDGGPVVNGGNCLGVRSRPGRLDTLFIPAERFGDAPRRPAPVALVSQSGAFAVARLSRYDFDPRYVITLGNQLDLTIGDYLDHLVDDPGVGIVAVYVEGFRPGDGLAFLDAAARFTSSGRPVLLYRAGRTAEGAKASASHTAAVAGDFAVTSALAAQAGVTVVDTLEEFDDLLTLHVALGDRAPGNGRLGAMSNAGFECVTLADRLGSFRLAEFAPETRDAFSILLAGSRVDGVVAVHNPLDVTPMMGDEAFAEAARVLLADPGVDLGVIGCVPLTAALDTLHPGEGTLADRLVALWRETDRPWVTVVDGGPPYDAFARRLESGGVPVFRRLDRALAVLGRWAEARTLRTENTISSH